MHDYEQNHTKQVFQGLKNEYDNNNRMASNIKYNKNTRKLVEVSEGSGQKYPKNV